MNGRVPQDPLGENFVHINYKTQICFNCMHGCFTTGFVNTAMISHYTQLDRPGFISEKKFIIKNGHLCLRPVT